MRRAARVDANQAQVVSALRAAGATVYPMHRVGGGFPDLLVTYRRQTHLIEVKDGSKPPSKRELTEDEAKFHSEWAGGPIHVVTSADEALVAVGAIS